MSFLREVEAVVRDVGLVDDERQRGGRRQRRVEQAHERLHYHRELIVGRVATAVHLQL